jgi:hypothetical protein
MKVKRAFAYNRLFDALVQLFREDFLLVTYFAAILALWTLCFATLLCEV